MRKFFAGKNAAFYIAFAVAVITLVAAAVLPAVAAGQGETDVSAVERYLLVAGGDVFMVFVAADMLLSALHKEMAAAAVRFTKIGTAAMAVLVFAALIMYIADVSEFLVGAFTDFAMTSGEGLLSIPGLAGALACIITMSVLAVLGNVLYWVPFSGKKKSDGCGSDRKKSERGTGEENV